MAKMQIIKIQKFNRLTSKQNPGIQCITIDFAPLFVLYMNPKDHDKYNKIVASLKNETDGFHQSRLQHASYLASWHNISH